MISQKMNALREKYEKLKSDHNAMKNKMESEKAEEKKMDNEKVSTLIAAFTASQGALTAFKEALIDHLKNNNYPLDGLELDTSSFNQVPAAAPVPAEEEAPAAPAPAPEEEAPAPEEEAPAQEKAPAAPAPQSEAAAEVVDNEQPNSEPSEDVNENTETSMLESGSKSPDNENEGGDQTESSALPEIPVNEIPETSVVDNTAASSDSASINGGRSHYVHSTNKKAATHRHHKRRNRHQTLRGYKK